MAGSELHFLTIAEASRRIAQRELSPVELTETYLQRIAAVDHQLMSFVTLTAELALQPAPAAARGAGRGGDQARGPAQPAARHPLLPEGHHRDGRDPDHGAIKAAGRP